MSTARKPNKRQRHKVAVEAAAVLRDLIADFCRQRGGTQTSERHASDDFGTFGATWSISTRLGVWLVHEPSDPSTDLLSINTRFEEPARVGNLLSQGPVTFNSYSGKWNHHATADHVDDARSFMIDFEHRSAFLFQETLP